MLDELRAFDAGLDVVVVSDGSTTRPPTRARRRGAHVVPLPFNLGIGGAVQTGFRYAAQERLRARVRVDGDGQHDPAELGPLLASSSRARRRLRRLAFRRRGGLPLVGDAAHRHPHARRLVSLLTAQRLTDTTCGFQALNRKAIELFAADYPHDYPEVEAAVMAHKHRLRLAEVPVRMREREHGRSSIHGLRTVYYMAKVCSRSSSDLFGGGRPRWRTRDRSGQTPLAVSIAATAASLFLLLVVFELIRSRRLRERYALLWLLTGLVLVVLSAWRGGLNTIAGWFGVRPIRRRCCSRSGCSSSSCCCTTRR